VQGLPFFSLCFYIAAHSAAVGPNPLRTCQRIELSLLQSDCCSLMERSRKAPNVESACSRQFRARPSQLPNQSSGCPTRHLLSQLLLSTSKMHVQLKFTVERADTIALCCSSFQTMKRVNRGFGSSNATVLQVPPCYKRSAVLS
jgi:hypothetical protein